MGGSESKSSELKHELLFSEEERQKISNVFCSISHAKKSFNKDQFQHFITSVLDHFTSSRLFDLISGPLPREQHHRHHHHNQEVHLQHFASHLGILLKGDLQDLARTCIFLASTTENSVSAQDFVKLVSSILQSYENLLSAHCVAFQSWIFSHQEDSHKRLACSLLQDVMNAGGRPESEMSFNESEVEKWLSQCPLFSQIMKQVLIGAFELFHAEPHLRNFNPGVPQVHDTNWSKFKTILDFPTVLYLNFSLSSHLQSQWKLLFSSNLHGASFSQLLQHIRDKGPSYLVVQDDHGHIFGGFASISWGINSKFTGNSSCFLFRVKPEYAVYQPTGYNNNFMYMNHHVQTLPNGLGMGGQLDYFGLWIDQEYGRGHSKTGSRGCTTYGSPQLSEEAEFKVANIEVWAVGKMRKEGEEEEEEDAEQADGAKRYNKKKTPGVWNSYQALIITDAVKHPVLLCMFTTGETKALSHQSMKHSIPIQMEEEFGVFFKAANKGGGKKGILDKLSSADKAILDMVDKGTISEGIRDEPLEEAGAAHNTIISPF